MAKTRALLLLVALAAATMGAEAAPGGVDIERMGEKLNIPFSTRSMERRSSLSPIRLKRTSEHQLLECIEFALEEGDYYYEHNSMEEAVCGAYLMGPPDVNIEIRFNYVDVPCENRGLIAVVDGWELNGELFPSPRDHPLSTSARFNEFCGKSRKIKNVFRSSQNAALIQFRMTGVGSSLSFNVRYVKNPTPCNTLGPYDRADNEDNFFYTIRNYGKRSNCSASVIFPAAVKVLDMNVGVTPTKGRAIELETGVIHKVRSECHKRGLDDYAQIGGSTGLDNRNLQLADSICGLFSKPARTEFINCGVTTVRLSSSGVFDNSLTIMMSRMDPTSPGHMSVSCYPEDILK